MRTLLEGTLDPWQPDCDVRLAENGSPKRAYLARDFCEASGAFSKDLGIEIALDFYNRPVYWRII